MKNWLETKNLTWIFIIAHLAFTLPLAFVLNLWLDEAWTMRTTANLTNVWSEAVSVERQAPLYFLLVAAWRTVNDSLFFARLFSVVCSVAAIFVFARLAEKLLPSRRVQIAAIGFFAFHPFLIWAAAEARSYALIVLLSCLLVWLWLEAYAAPEKNENSKRIFYLLLAAASLYANYYLGFLLAANAVALACLRRYGALKTYIWQMTIVGAVALLPLAFIIRTQFALNVEYFRVQPTIFEGARLLWHHANEFILPAEVEVFALARLWILRLGTIALCYALIKNRKNLRKLTVALGAISATVAVFLPVTYFLLGELYFELRHAAPLFAPLMLFVAALLGDLAARRVQIATAILLAFFYITSLFATYAPIAKRGDWQRVALFIEQNDQPNQPIVIFRVYDELPFRFYYLGANKIVAENVRLEWYSEDAPETPTRWRRQIEFVVSNILEGHEKSWLVTEDRCDDEKLSIECRPLEEFVAAHYVVERTQNFYTRKVRLLRRKTNGDK